MESALSILEDDNLTQFLTLDETEVTRLKRACNLIKLKYPDHALMELWNAAIHNLRRRVELYSIEMFLSAISGCGGKKTYKKDGDTLSERWSGIDDSVLIAGATQLGILNKKGGKTLEMIEWMRNHASPSHNNDECVNDNEVLGLVVMLKSNLFDIPMPDPTHSPSGLLKPIKEDILTKAQIELINEQIDSSSNKDIRTIFGYSLDTICQGNDPSYTNIVSLFNHIWNKATDELKSNMGMRLHNYLFDPKSDNSSDSSAAERIYEALLSVKGIKYVPESTRALIFRKLARGLARAKDTPYGWTQEETASRALCQVGVCVPSVAFDDVYQEILRVWCGNYWGRSNAHTILKDFIFSLQPKGKVKVAKLFESSTRVEDELFQTAPKKYALNLLDDIKKTLSNQSQILEIDNVITKVKKL